MRTQRKIIAASFLLLFSLIALLTCLSGCSDNLIVPSQQKGDPPADQPFTLEDHHDDRLQNAAALDDPFNDNDDPPINNRPSGGGTEETDIDDFNEDTVVD